MSMISAQINELRKWADQLSERENEFGVVVRALVAALRNAADTIWRLRDDLQRANAAVQDAEHDESVAWDRVHKAEAENAKLRELVCWMYDRMDESCAVQYPYAPAPISYDRLMQAQARARELGVDVS